MAAVHEAGHVVIARRVGFKIASAWVIPNAGDNAEVEGTWMLGIIGLAFRQNRNVEIDQEPTENEAKGK